MDLDAILFFIEKLKTENVTQNELLILASCITNGCIDINRSLNELLFLVASEYDEENILGLIEHNNSFYQEPIYMVLYKNEKFRMIIINSLRKRNLLTDTSYLNFLSSLMDAVLELDEEKAVEVLLFIMDLIGVRGKQDVLVFQNSSRLRKFVKDHLKSLVKGGMKGELGKEQLERLIIIKLFSNGFVLFGNYFDISISYEDLLLPLFESKSYSYLRLVFNSKVVSLEDFDWILELAITLFHENQESMTFDEKIAADSAIESFSLYIDSEKKKGSY